VQDADTFRERVQVKLLCVWVTQQRLGGGQRGALPFTWQWGCRGAANPELELALWTPGVAETASRGSQNDK